MAASLSLLCEDVLDAYPFGKHRRVLDIGGGEGGFLCELAVRAPHAELVLFDLPAVAARAEARLSARGLSGRSRVVPGDFRSDPLPEGADLAVLVRILLDHDDETVRRLLRSVHDALAEDGTIVIAEPVSDAGGARRMGDAYFGFYLMAMGHGRVRTTAEHAALLVAAGFRSPRRVRTRRPLLTGMISAHR
jgi:demethylspheroidene O-methyltransferase